MKVNEILDFLKKIVSGSKNLAFILEFALLCLVQLWTKYSTLDYFIKYGDVYLLVIYIILNYKLIKTVPKELKYLLIAHGLCMLGFLNSFEARDILFPFRTFLFNLAVLGIFSQKYNSNSTIFLYAIVAIVLIPYTINESIARNELLVETDEVLSRRGFNLLAHYSFIGFSFCFLLPKKFKLISLLFLTSIIYYGSRTSFIMSLVFFLYFYDLLELKKLIFITFIVLLIGYIFLNDIYVQSYFNENDWKRISDISGARYNSWFGWINFLFNNPSIIGHGIVSYPYNFPQLDYPLNIYLHYFNGAGILGGGFFIFSLIKILVNRKQDLKTLNRQMILIRNNVETARILNRIKLIKFSTGFLIAYMISGISELTDIVGDNMHIISFISASAIGWGSYILKSNNQ